MNVYLFAHVPMPKGGRRAKASRGAPAQARIPAKSEVEARKAFVEQYPDREITASGILGVG